MQLALIQEDINHIIRIRSNSGRHLCRELLTSHLAYQQGMRTQWFQLYDC